MAKRILPRNLVDRDGHLIAFSDREMSSLESEGLDYLRTVERMLGDLPVESTVRFGNPTEEILREADDDGADLIVVTTTGRNGRGEPCSAAWPRPSSGVRACQSCYMARGRGRVTALPREGASSENGVIRRRPCKSAS